ncbi:hypothetical protein DEJ48_01030 [Streptomyces venezuelae]|uniref:Thioester reductase (TE) domain-containing protein n=1 Tax=Streptomyces venezuelae TaxID=54571 RepID=A0A5P2BNZ3_STRVZ|nr:hypothetical protein DEJ48_01030 [Streptomyces venezuelae]
MLLTGVTGSLGGHLRTELLNRTPATVYCLPRGAADRTQHRLARLGRPPGGAAHVNLAGTEVDEQTPATTATAGPLGYSLTKVRPEHDLRAAAGRGTPLTGFPARSGHRALPDGQYRRFRSFGTDAPRLGCSRLCTAGGGHGPRRRGGRGGPFPCGTVPQTGRGRRYVPSDSPGSRAADRRVRRHAPSWIPVGRRGRRTVVVFHRRPRRRSGQLAPGRFA